MALHIDERQRGNCRRVKTNERGLVCLSRMECSVMQSRSSFGDRDRFQIGLAAELLDK